MQKDKTNYPTYKFSAFTEEDAILAFNLKVQDNPKGLLDEWLAKCQEMKILAEEAKQLHKLQTKYKRFVRTWYEQELRERFIIPVIELVDFDMLDLQVVAFSERDLKVIYKNTIIHGKAEWMVATGISSPKHPFFFIHEYKKETASSNDPVGQLLATLYTAQLHNQQTPEPTLFNPNPSSFKYIPLYGCYVVGRLWFFVRLKENQYYISKSYDSTDKEDLHFIFKMLKAQKEMIIALVKGQNG